MELTVRRHEPTYYRRSHDIYIFTTGGVMPSDIRMQSNYSVACIGFNCHGKPVSPVFSNWKEVGGGSDLNSLTIALNMFSKKIHELNENMKASRPTIRNLHMTNEGPPATTTVSWASSQIRIKNTVDVLTHLHSRVQQRIADIANGELTRYLSNEEFYMHPFVNIEASIKVVFYHGPQDESLRNPTFPITDRDFWTGKFNYELGYEFKFARVKPHEDANPIDIIYPVRNDDKKQKLCEYEASYDLSDGAIKESNQAVREATARQQKLAEDAIAAAEREAAAAEREAAAAERAAKIKAAAAEREAAAAEREAAAAVAAQQAMLSTPWNKIKTILSSILNPPSMGMGGKSKRARTQKRLSKSKKSIKRNSQRHRKTSRKH
jgi:hypothetical protein